MSSVTVYKAIVGNPSLQHDFEVVIPNLPGADGFLLKFLAAGATTPDREIIGTEVWWRGRKGEFPAILRTDGEWEVTFNIDSNWVLYDMLYAAHLAVYNPITGVIPSWATLAFSVKIKMLKGPVPIRTFTLLDCWVKTIGEVTKSHASESDKDEVPLTIHYDDWIYSTS